MKSRFWLIVFAGLTGVSLALTGCARLFGWDIHAPGLLSESFSTQVSYRHERAALYLPPSVMRFQSKDKRRPSAHPPPPPPFSSPPNPSSFPPPSIF